MRKAVTLIDVYLDQLTDARAVLKRHIPEGAGTWCSCLRMCPCPVVVAWRPVERYCMERIEFHRQQELHEAELVEWDDPRVADLLPGVPEALAAALDDDYTRELHTVGATSGYPTGR